MSTHMSMHMSTHVSTHVSTHMPTHMSTHMAYIRCNHGHVGTPGIGRSAEHAGAHMHAHVHACKNRILPVLILTIQAITI